MELTYRVHRFVLQNRRAQKTNLHIHEMTILQALPNGLRMRLHGACFMPLLKIHPLFFHLHEFDKDCMLAIAFHAIKEQTLLVEHELFSFDQEAKSMYFLTRGQLDYYPEGARSDVKRVEDKYLCEVALWMLWYHTGKVISSRPSELANLSSHSFRHHALKFQHHGRLQEYARLYSDLVLDRRWKQNKEETLTHDPADIAGSFDDCQELAQKVFEGLIEHIEQSGMELLSMKSILKRGKSLARNTVRGR